MDVETLTADDILMTGLQLMFTDHRINNVKGDPFESKTNTQRFKDHYGAKPSVVAQIWEDLQLTNNPNYKIEPKKLCIHALLEAMHFLYRYQRESEREARFDKSPKTLRKHCWYYLTRIQALKEKKIVFPDTFGDDVWIMTVDGTHFLINEPTHPIFSQDKKYFSHKKNHAGLCYELGIHLFESKLIWMNGPFPAGSNDKGNFVKRGLKEKLASIGKKALGDKIYNGYPNECSTWNAFDDPAVKSFKSRAQMRHEQFNGMLCEFSCLDDRFRHGEAQFKVCFEACSVICQYRLDNGEPLFDLLAGIRFENDEEEES